MLYNSGLGDMRPYVSFPEDGPSSSGLASQALHPTSSNIVAATFDRYHLRLHHREFMMGNLVPPAQVDPSGFAIRRDHHNLAMPYPPLLADTMLKHCSKPCSLTYTGTRTVSQHIHPPTTGQDAVKAY